VYRPATIDGMNAADLVPVSTAAAWFPHRHRVRPSADSLATRSETGRIGVQLKATKSGGQWFSCREWVEDFLLRSLARPANSKPGKGWPKR
jgi:hypothetical protein